MAARLRTHLRSNVVGYIALFVALSGTAYAASALDRNEVRSKHIGKGQVRTSDLAKGSVASPKVANGSLLREDFAADQLLQGPQGERGFQGPQGERGPQGEQGIQGEPGRDGILDAVGRSGHSDARCIPGFDSGLPIGSTPDPAHCAGTSLTLSRTARVYLVADADWGIYGGGASAGECRLTIDGAPIAGGPVTHPGERDVSDPDPGTDDLDFSYTETVDYYGHTGLTHVTAPLAPGTHDFGLLCGQTDDDLLFDNATISALAISPN